MTERRVGDVLRSDVLVSRSDEWGSFRHERPFREERDRFMQKNTVDRVRKDEGVSELSQQIREMQKNLEKLSAYVFREKEDLPKLGNEPNEGNDNRGNEGRDPGTRGNGSNVDVQLPRLQNGKHETTARPTMVASATQVSTNFTRGVIDQSVDTTWKSTKFESCDSKECDFTKSDVGSTPRSGDAGAGEALDSPLRLSSNKVTTSISSIERNESNWCNDRSSFNSSRTSMIPDIPSTVQDRTSSSFTSSSLAPEKTQSLMSSLSNIQAAIPSTDEKSTSSFASTSQISNIIPTVVHSKLRLRSERREAERTQEGSSVSASMDSALSIDDLSTPSFAKFSDFGTRRSKISVNNLIVPRIQYAESDDSEKEDAIDEEDRLVAKYMRKVR